MTKLKNLSKLFMTLIVALSLSIFGAITLAGCDPTGDKSENTSTLTNAEVKQVLSSMSSNDRTKVWKSKYDEIYGALNILDRLVIIVDGEKEIGKAIITQSGSKLIIEEVGLTRNDYVRTEVTFRKAGQQGWYSLHDSKFEEYSVVATDVVSIIVGNDENTGKERQENDFRWEKLSATEVDEIRAGERVDYIRSLPTDKAAVVDRSLLA